MNPRQEEKSFQSQLGLRGRSALEEDRARHDGFGDNGDLSSPQQQCPSCPFEPLWMGTRSPQGLPDPANREDCRILKEISHQAGQEGPQGSTGDSRLPLLSPWGSICVTAPQEERGSCSHRTPFWGQSGDVAAASCPSGLRPAQARSRQASYCPSYRDQLPEAPPVPSTSPTQQPSPTPQLRPLLSQPLH